MILLEMRSLLRLEIQVAKAIQNDNDNIDIYLFESESQWGNAYVLAKPCTHDTLMQVYISIVTFTAQPSY